MYDWRTFLKAQSENVILSNMSPMYLKGIRGVRLCVKACIGVFVIVQIVIALVPHGYHTPMERDSESSNMRHPSRNYPINRDDIILKRDLLVNKEDYEDSKNVYNDERQTRKHTRDTEFGISQPHKKMLLQEVASRSSMKVEENRDVLINELRGDKSSGTSKEKWKPEMPNNETVTYSRNPGGSKTMKLKLKEMKPAALFPSKPLCPQKPTGLVGRMEFTTEETPPTMAQIASQNKDIGLGGLYSPPNCTSRFRVAFIIPHRARELHLRSLLSHLLPILKRQQLHFRIFVVHQSGENIFNKAKLMNGGFLEALKLERFDCVVFHDVDLLPEDDRLIYSCTDAPRHLSVAIDKYKYKLPYSSIFGGVTLFNADQFRDVNGFSNNYWGWGGEDDDMFNRVFSRGYTITRPPLDLARYKMSQHSRDKGNKVNLVRFIVLSESVERMHNDGLSNVQYDVMSIVSGPLYTNITLDVGTAEVTCKPYVAEWSCRFVLWFCDLFEMGCSLLQYNGTEANSLPDDFVKGPILTSHESDEAQPAPLR